MKTKLSGGEGSVTWGREGRKISFCSFHRFELHSIHVHVNDLTNHVAGLNK